MDTKISSNFWSLEDIENLDSDGKLVMLWLKTSSSIDLCGIVRPTVKRFKFETGLPEKLLWDTVDRLPNLLAPFKAIGAILVRGFIHEQLGRGKALSNNNIFKSVVNAAAAVQEMELIDALVGDCPELADKLEALGKPFEGVSKPLGRGSQGQRERTEKEIEQSKREGGAGGREDLFGVLEDPPALPPETPPPPPPPVVPKAPPARKDRGTVEEFVEFCVSIELPATDGVAMHDRWEGNGWKNGSGPVKDWRATIRSWRAQGYLPSQKADGNGKGHGKKSPPPDKAPHTPTPDEEIKRL